MPIANHVAQDAIQRIESKKLAEQMRQNHQQFYLMTDQEFFEFYLNYKKQKGEATFQTIEKLEAKYINQQQKITWQQKKEQLLTLEDPIKQLGFWLPIFSDSLTLGKLAGDLKAGGSILTKYKVVHKNGKNYIILKGNQKLRHVLTGTRYLTTHKKMLNLGIGKLGVNESIKGGVIISIVFSVSIHIAEQILEQKSTWHNFIAGVSSDLISATLTSLTTSIIITILIPYTSSIIMPMLFVVIIGGGLAYLYNEMLTIYQLEKKIYNILINFSENIENNNLRLISPSIYHMNKLTSESPYHFLEKLLGLTLIQIKR